MSNIIEKKTDSRGIVTITTRGQLGLRADGTDGIGAMTGFQRKYASTPELIEVLSDKINNDEDHAKELHFPYMHLRPLTHVYKGGGHQGLVVEDRIYKIKYDNKRLIDTEEK